MNLNDFMKKQSAPVQGDTAAPESDPFPFDEIITEGRRNTTLSEYAGNLNVRFGDTEQARKLFLEKASSCSPPLPERVSAQEGYIPPEEYNNPTPRKPGDYSDLGQAYIFAKFCRDYVRYSPATDYIVYDGICWQESKPRAQAALDEFTDAQLKEAEQHIADTERYMAASGADSVIAEHGKNAPQHMNEEQLKAYYANLGAVAYRAFVVKRRDSKYLTAALKEARPMVPHSNEDFITKCTAVSPGDKGADIWQKALDTFFCGDEELKDYVQKIAGLAAIGHVYIEALIIAYGEGRNGKSTFWNVVSRVLGSYSGNISADALTVGCKRNVKPELAEAKGKRLLIAAELEEGMRLNTSVVKQFCSTDEIFAEKKYKDPFSFTPSHTLVLYTNHLPKVGANDPGTWRRLIVVPFNAKIEGIADRKNYADYLFENAGEAVLTWIIEGAEAVIKADFQIEQPECVKEATSAYHENSDWLGDGYSSASGELYAQYRDYCQRTGEYTRSTTDFYAAIEFAGYTRRRTKSGRFVDGLRLKSDFEEPFLT